MEDKFRYWLETENGRKEIFALHQRLQVEPKRDEKSEEICLEFKLKGTEAFVEKRGDEAHSFYSLALRRAPADSPSIPLLFGNRSAALFQMNMFQDSLIDIENAEKSGFPQNLKCKLLMRRIRCFLQLQKSDESSAALEELEEIAAKHDPKGIHNKSISALSELCHKMSKKDQATRRTNGIAESYPIPPLFHGESQNLCSMSSALEIRSNPDEGRHIITTRKIPKGSVLVVEKPFAAILLAENALTHCQTCLKMTNTPVPCEWCCDVVFCSACCRTSGLTFHRYECPMLRFLSKFRIAHLAIRLLLVAGLKTCRTIRNETMKKPTDNVGPTNVGPTKEDEYRAVYSRVTHTDEHTHENELNYATVAITLSQALLEKSTFFEDHFVNNNETIANLNQASNNKNIDSIYENNDCGANGGSKSLGNSEELKKTLKVELSCILMHHIMCVISNGHGIDEYRRCSEDSDELSPVTLTQIASAIYSSASLMNHSCKIYTINSFHDGILVIRNTEDLSPGDQVYTCYGPHFGEKPMFERQQKLEKQYFFKCACIACTDSSYIKEENRWRGVKCPACGETTNWRQSDGLMVYLNLFSREVLEASFRSVGPLECSTLCNNSHSSECLKQECFQVGRLNTEALNLINVGKLTRAKVNLVEAMELASRILDSRNEFLNTMRKTLSKTLAQCGEVDSGLHHLLLYLDYIKERHGKHSTAAAFEMLRILAIVKLWHNYGYTNLMKAEELEESIASIFTIHYGHRWRDFVKISEF